jgi:hypothetical protein
MIYPTGINLTKLTVKSLTRIGVLVSTLSASYVYAIPEQCVRMPNQTNVCEHVIYKTVENLNAASLPRDGDVYCVCLQDFSHLILPGATASEREQQKLEMENISRVLDITEQQLIRLIRY